MQHANGACSRTSTLCALCNPLLQATAQAISFLKIIMEYEIAPLLSLYVRVIAAVVTRIFLFQGGEMDAWIVCR